MLFVAKMFSYYTDVC